jgi:ArsR family transcriptional regulator
MVTTVLSALAEPTRLAAVHLLSDGQEHCVCELMAKLQTTQSRMSRHMKTLLSAGLVIGRRDAQWVRYRMSPDLPAEYQNIIDAVLAAEYATQRNVA